MQLTARIETYPLHEPFATAATTIDSIDVAVVTLEQGGFVGRGEAAGVYYKNETPQRVLQQIEERRQEIIASPSREALQIIFPPGGARNAVDCALWDLEAKRTQRPVWQIAGLAPPRKLVTLLTCGAADPKKMANVARRYDAPAIKIKLLGDAIDADRVRAVREAAPRAWLTVDANQAFGKESYIALLPVLVEMEVGLVEQPFPANEDRILDEMQSPIPLAADESAECLSDLPSLVGRFGFVNIKLDKCGGLTEALAMVRRARELGLKTYAGNMFGTSLAMAPAFILGQICDVVELDGPLFLKRDRAHTVEYSKGHISCSDRVWGGAH
jgi:L-alanine-DL-glutamate epimerase-like enolase superfamily enzyme